MISVHILIPDRNRETGQSRLCNTSGSETIPGTSKTGNIGDKVQFELSVSFHQLGLSQLQFVPESIIRPVVSVTALT